MQATTHDSGELDFDKQKEESDTQSSSPSHQQSPPCLHVPHPDADVTVIGGGLAGCECAWQLAQRGWRVALYEMKPDKKSPAHQSDDLAELVCSNSLKSDIPETAHGLLKSELGRLDSLLVSIARQCRIPAGQALAVDRHQFSNMVTAHMEDASHIILCRGEVKGLPDPSDPTVADQATCGGGHKPKPIVLATGPLTEGPLAQSLGQLLGAESQTPNEKSSLYFYDAIAPILNGDSVDQSVAFFSSRYDKGGADYLNCPFTKEEYDLFYRELLIADQVTPHAFEKIRYFQGCQPIEAIAHTGEHTLRFGPMKPVGLIDPRTGNRPYAVVQLRRQAESGTTWNMVGFQTRLRYPEQRRVFRLIPGLAQASFMRHGSIHRNTYIDAPGKLSDEFSTLANPNLFIAGQITGVEGYVESIASGLMVGLAVDCRLRGRPFLPPPPQTALGALFGHCRRPPTHGAFAPTAIHFGLFPPLGRKVSKRERGAAHAQRADGDFAAWLASTKAAAAAAIPNQVATVSP